VIVQTTNRPLYEIARDALMDPTLKGNARVYATPYLEALLSCETGHDRYYADTADSCVRYALSNLTYWRGDTAKAIKDELKAHLLF
jgi:hypothetical protein